MIKVCVLGGFNLTPALHELNIELSKIKGHTFAFPDLDHIKDQTKYYESIRNIISESECIILLTDNKNVNKFFILFGMAFQSSKELKIISLNEMKKFIGDKIDGQTS